MEVSLQMTRGGRRSHGEVVRGAANQRGVPVRSRHAGAATAVLTEISRPSALSAATKKNTPLAETQQKIRRQKTATDGGKKRGRVQLWSVERC